MLNQQVIPTTWLREWIQIWHTAGKRRADAGDLAPLWMTAPKNLKPIGLIAAQGYAAGAAGLTLAEACKRICRQDDLVEGALAQHEEARGSKNPPII